MSGLQFRDVADQSDCGSSDADNDGDSPSSSVNDGSWLLVPRVDCDSSSLSDAGAPPLVPRAEYDTSSSSDNDGPPPLDPRVDYDSSSSSDNDVPPPLIPRIDSDSSSDDDSLAEKLMPTSTRRKMTKGPTPFGNRIEQPPMVDCVSSSDDDSSSSSDSDELPIIIPRVDYDSSSDDGSLAEKLMPKSTRRKMAKGPMPFGNYIKQPLRQGGLRDQKADGPKEMDKKQTNFMEDAMKVMEEKAAILDIDIDTI